MVVEAPGPDNEEQPREHIDPTPPVGRCFVASWVPFATAHLSIELFSGHLLLWRWCGADRLVLFTMSVAFLIHVQIGIRDPHTETKSRALLNKKRILHFETSPKF